MHELAQFLSQPLAMELTAAKSFVSTFQCAGRPDAEDKYLLSKYSPSAHLLDEHCVVIREPSQEGDALPRQPMALDAAMQSIGDGQKVTAVVPLWGALSMHGGWFSTSTNDFARTVTKLDANQSISTIITWINSPGGTVTGTDEAATALRAVRDRGDTRTISVVEPMMASAATWIGTAAGEVVVTPSGQAGSIGVISMYEDWSKALETMGINIEIERIPDKKARFTGVEPMSEEMREEIQRLNRDAFEQFVGAMAKNRGVTARQVRQNFGGGEMMSAIEARDAGLVDRIATFDEVISGLGKPGRAKGSRRAEICELKDCDSESVIQDTIGRHLCEQHAEELVNDPTVTTEPRIKTKRSAAVEAARERLAEIEG